MVEAVAAAAAAAGGTKALIGPKVGRSDALQFTPSWQYRQELHGGSGHGLHTLDGVGYTPWIGWIGSPWPPGYIR
eukprot:1159076-Pelagomonas_calceolata.AAC.2